MVIRLVIGLKHELCASVKVSAGNTWWTSLWGNCTSEAAGIGSGKVQGDGRGGGDQPALRQIVSHLDAGKCLDALHTPPRC